MLTTRVAGPADAAATARLWTAANLARRAHLGLDTTTPASPAEDVLRRRLSGPAAVLVLAEDDGSDDSGDDPVAMAMAVQALSEDGAGPDAVPGLAHVTMIAVHPLRWGRHLGGLVLDRAQVEARRLGYTRAQLWTQESNHRAQRLYERLGWTPSGRTTTDGHGERICHYTRDL